MDTNTLALELIKVLVWPATIVLVIILLRPSLLELVPMLRRLRYRDFELEFERRLEQAAARANQAQLPRARAVKVLAQTATAGGASLPELIEPIALRSPRAGVAEAWRLMKEAVQQNLESLPAPVVSLVADLEALRNEVIHNSAEITFGQTLEYAVLAQRVVDAIESRDRQPARPKGRSGT